MPWGQVWEGEASQEPSELGSGIETPPHRNKSPPASSSGWLPERSPQATGDPASLSASGGNSGKGKSLGKGADEEWPGGGQEERIKSVAPGPRQPCGQDQTGPYLTPSTSIRATG